MPEIALNPPPFNAGRGEGTDDAGLNPLHCGAVVASPSPGGSGSLPTRVSIPFIAGQWSLRVLRDAVSQAHQVSIPFIAGQWSLLVGGGVDRFVERASLNPLHCGAVVASRVQPVRGGARLRVSIPFIAGKWSLHG